MEEKTDCQDAGGTLQPSNGSQVLYEKALSCVDEKRIELTSGSFTVQGSCDFPPTNVVLFPVNRCSCPAGRSGICYHILACKMAIGIRDCSRKKRNVTAYHRNSRKMSGNGRSGRKRTVNAVHQENPSRESEEAEIRMMEMGIDPDEELEKYQSGQRKIGRSPEKQKKQTAVRNAN